MRACVRSTHAFLGTLFGAGTDFVFTGGSIRGMASPNVGRASSSCFVPHGKWNTPPTVGHGRPPHPALHRRTAFAHKSASRRNCGARDNLLAKATTESSAAWRSDAAVWASGLGAKAAQDEWSVLKSEIEKHDAAYYLDADPLISDAAYDKLRVKVEALEGTYPALVTANSPTKRVGVVVAKKKESAEKTLNENIEKYEKNEKKLAANESAAHELPMLSLSNVFSVDEAVGFEVKLRRALGGEWFDEDAFDVGGAVQPRAGAAEKNQKNKNELEIKFIAEPKIDGASASVTYVDGVLVRCVSRGDGTTGEDVSRQLAGALGIPEKLNDVGGGKKIPRKIEIRGEVFIADDDFLTVNSRRTENGLVPFRNPRNAVAGALRKLGGTCAHDGTEVWPLRFITYAWGAVVGDEEYEESESGQNSEKNEPSPSLFWRSQSEFKEFARSVGLTPVPTLASGNGIRSVLGAHTRLSENKPKNSPTDGESNRRREDLGYAVDGVVYKVDCVSLQKKLGADARAPRWATAHKFPAATGVTVLHAIEIQVGRTGALTPVAVLSPPVDLGGATIARATLHNFPDIARKNLKVGSWVVVERAGDVIPRVVGLADTELCALDASDGDVGTLSTRSNLFVYSPPTQCPSCGSAARRAPIFNAQDSEGAILRCTGGLRCPAQAVERISHFVSRDALDVGGLAKATIQSLFDEAVIKTPNDLFTVRRRYESSLQANSEGHAKGEENTDNAENRTGVAMTRSDASTTRVVPPFWRYQSGKNLGKIKLSTSKLFDALDTVKLRGVPLARFLYALGIPTVGLETAKVLAKEYGTLHAFRVAAGLEWELRKGSAGGKGDDDADLIGETSVSETSSETSSEKSLPARRMTDVEGIGPVVAAVVGQFWAEPGNVEVVDLLLHEGLVVQAYQESGNEGNKSLSYISPNAFEGKKVVVTGSVPNMTRTDAAAAVTMAGGISQAVVSGKTDILVLGDGAGRRKALAAEQKGVTVIDAETFLAILRGDARL